jgi:hypothetical protein
MRELRRKILLPVFQLSELAEFDDVGSIQRSIRQGKGHTLRWTTATDSSVMMKERGNSATTCFQ